MGKLTGTTNGEKLNGTKADDEIYLLGGDDTCTADLGNDVVYGGDGDDIIWGRYSNTIGDDGNDTFYGEAGNDELYGGTGNDKLDGGDGNDELDGQEGNDSLLGGAGSDILDGGEGNDLLYGGDGDDNFYAGSGNDKAWGGNGNDIIWAIYKGELDDGDDTFYGEGGDDKLYGYAGNDTLDGGEGADYLSGGDGADSLIGGIGNDDLNGGAGIDLLYGGDGDDDIYAGSGNDKAWGGNGNDIIWAIFTGELDDGDDTFYGEGGDDKLYGYAGNDTLNGGAGDDTLKGGDGNDVLDGGDGNDLLDGGTGIDTATYSKAASNYTIQIDGPAVVITDKLTKEKDILTSIEKLSFAGVVSDASVFGKVSVDFNTLPIPEKKVILEEQYKALIYEGTKKWSGTSFTYSFAQSQLYSDLSKYSNIPTGETYKFQLIGSSLQNVIRETFDYLSAILPLTFTETANTLSATFKFASHNMTASGYAQKPTYSTSGSIEISSKLSSDKLGQFGVGTAIHELGHSLGLDHTSSRAEKSEYDGTGDDLPSIPDYLDRSSLSIMSYARVFVNDARQSSYSALDVRALFSLYGKRESTEDTTFKLHYDSSLSTTSKQDSLNKIETGQWDIYGYAPFMIVDNGGTDTVDVSDWKGGVEVDLSGWGIGPIGGAKYNYTFNSATNGSLRAEGTGSPIVTIYPDTVIERVIGSPEADIIIGYSAAEILDGGAGNDQINGGGGNDQITGGGGNDTIDGGVGIDIAKFSSPLGTTSSSNYSIQKLNDTAWSISYKGPVKAIFPPPITDGTDQLKNIERVQFTDKNIALDLSGNAGTTAKVIGAVKGTSEVQNSKIFGLWLSYIDKGMSYSDLGALALTSVGATTNDAVVSTLWKNVIGTDASAEIKAPFIKMLTDGMKVGDLVVLAADTSFNTTNINLVGLAQTGIEYIPVV